MVDGPRIELIEYDLPCRRCDYNLRGLTRDAMCPECAAPAELSLRSDLLRHSNPSWVGQLYLGMKIVLAGDVLLVPAAAYAGLARGNRVSSRTPELALLLVYVLIVAGVWHLTEPDPSGAGENTSGTSRRAARWLSIIGLIDNSWFVILSNAILSPQVFTIVAVSALHHIGYHVDESISLVLPAAFAISDGADSRWFVYVGACLLRLSIFDAAKPVSVRAKAPTRSCTGRTNLKYDMRPFGTAAKRESFKLLFRQSAMP